MAQGVRRDRLRDARLIDRPFEGALEGLVEQVVAAHDAGAWVGAVVGSGEDVLPCPFLRRVRIFLPQCMRQFHVDHAAREIHVVHLAAGGELVA